MDISQLLTHAVSRGASDLHLSAGSPPVLRIDGDMQPMSQPALSRQDARRLIEAITTDSQRGAFDTRQDIDFSVEIATNTAADTDAPAQNPARCRVNVFMQDRGPAAVLRIIPQLIPSLDDLGIPTVCKEIARAPQGLVLVTGPTGCGKSTTLAALIRHKNATEKAHILTLEDPIEFIHTPDKCLINQREIARDTADFNTALRAALREDPDTILIGEMRDPETIRLALTAAETGHLVLATLHTASATRTIDRIIDVFPGEQKALIRTMLAQSLHAVISQKLVKCATGGRRAAHEIMVATPAIRNLIREGKTAQMYSAIQTGQADGMQTLEQSLKQLANRASTTLEHTRHELNPANGAW